MYNVTFHINKIRLGHLIHHLEAQNEIVGTVKKGKWGIDIDDLGVVTRDIEECKYRMN